MAEWVDLLDPSPEELRAHLPEGVHPRALDQLLASAKHDDEPRPKLEGHGTYIFGVFLVPRAVPDEDRVYFQEVDHIATRATLLTVRKTPKDGEPLDISQAKQACRAAEGVAALPFEALHRAGAIEYIAFPAGLREKYQSYTLADLGRLRASGYAAPMRDIEAGVTKCVQALLAPSAVHP